MNIKEIDPQEVANPRELRVRVLPSPDANWLFIYTGIADINPTHGVSPSDDMSSWTALLNLSRLHNTTFNGHPFNLIIVNGKLLAAPTASLASIHGKQFDDDNTWSVSAVDVDEDNQELRLLINLATQGTGASFDRISYQVNILVHGPS